MPLHLLEVRAEVDDGADERKEHDEGRRRPDTRARASRGMYLAPATASPAARGTLHQNTARHPSVATSKPPAGGPRSH
jgi:hypothetical protein